MVSMRQVTGQQGGSAGVASINIEGPAASTFMPHSHMVVKPLSVVSLTSALGAACMALSCSS